MAKYKKDNLKIRVYRFLSNLFLYKIKNKKIGNYFDDLKWNKIDYQYGPSDLAEHRARELGWWNLFAANQLAESDCRYSKEEKRYIKVKEIIPYIKILQYFQVKKY